MSAKTEIRLKVKCMQTRFNRVELMFIGGETKNGQSAVSFVFVLSSAGEYRSDEVIKPVPSHSNYLTFIAPHPLNSVLLLLPLFSSNRYRTSLIPLNLSSQANEDEFNSKKNQSTQISIFNTFKDREQRKRIIKRPITLRGPENIHRISEEWRKKLEIMWRSTWFQFQSYFQE